MLKYVALLSFLLTVAGCASGPTYRSDYDRAADFGSYRTYGYVDELGTDKAGYSSLVTGHFRDAVDREMQALGYTYTENDPDLLVNFAANVHEVVDVRSRPGPTVGMGVGYGGYYGYRTGFYGTWPMYETEVETVRYKEGTANVDVIDADERRLIWEGVAEGRLSEEAMQNPREAISRTIAGIFERYPTAGE